MEPTYIGCTRSTSLQERKSSAVQSLFKHLYRHKEAKLTSIACTSYSAPLYSYRVAWSTFVLDRTVTGTLTTVGSSATMLPLWRKSRSGMQLPTAKRVRSGKRVLRYRRIQMATSLASRRMVLSTLIVGEATTVRAYSS